MQNFAQKDQWEGGSGMRVNGLISVSPRGGETVVYIARGDTGEVDALVLNAEHAALANGRYDTRQANGREESLKTYNKVTVYGSCHPDTRCGATLTLQLDNSRNLSFPARGMYDRHRKILFYQEFPPQAAQGRRGSILLSNLTGADVEIEEVVLEYSEKN